MKIYWHRFIGVPAIADLDFNTVSSKYSKAVILKYITNKKTFQPNYNVLDDPMEKKCDAGNSD